MEIKKSLAPVIHNSSRVLILGSMPSEESLRKQEYYGYPQNQFWRLTASVLGIGQPPDEYPSKLVMLQRGGIALWDVIASCTREGSLDTMIRDEVPNNIPGILSEAGAFGSRMYNLSAVFFNGQKAAQSYKRSFGFSILDDAGLAYDILPSSSPANTVGFARKLVKWQVISEYL